MKKHEEEHSNFFEDEIEKRNIKPTKLLPLWDLLGLGLGFGYDTWEKSSDAMYGLCRGGNRRTL